MVDRCINKYEDRSYKTNEIIIILLFKIVYNNWNKYEHH